jgi:NAD+ kinase
MKNNIGIISAKNNYLAEEKKNLLIKKFNFVDIGKDYKSDVELIVALGGDGLMLHLLHKYEKNPTPIYGINFGTVGFLMNKNKNDDEMIFAIENARRSRLHPLRMTAIKIDNSPVELIAINEVSLIRKSPQTAKIKVIINEKERIETLVADGVLVATEAGSTAYNSSARGAIIPFGAGILALTPISPFRPKNWHGALLPGSSKIIFEVIDFDERPVSATADYNEVLDVK